MLFLYESVLFILLNIVVCWFYVGLTVDRSVMLSTAPAPLLDIHVAVAWDMGRNCIDRNVLRADLVKKKKMLWIWMDLDEYVAGPFSVDATERELGVNTSPTERRLF